MGIVKHLTILYVFDSRGKKTAHKRHSFGSWTTLVVFDSIKNVLLLRVVC